MPRNYLRKLPPLPPCPTCGGVQKRKDNTTQTPYCPACYRGDRVSVPVQPRNPQLRNVN